MNLRLPKSNLAWEIRDANTRGFGEVELIAAFTMPSGEVLKSAHRVDRHYIERDPELADYVVRNICEDMGREVGRRLVMG